MNCSQCKQEVDLKGTKKYYFLTPCELYHMDCIREWVMIDAIRIKLYGWNYQSDKKLMAILDG